jgi:hypothetical protein
VEAIVLVVVNYVFILVLGAAYYLLGVRFAPDMSFPAALGVTVVTGLIACLATWLVLIRQHGVVVGERQAGILPLFVLVFSATIGIMLSVAQLVSATASPGADMKLLPLVIVVLNLVVLGLAAFSYTRNPRA